MLIFRDVNVGDFWGRHLESQNLDLFFDVFDFWIFWALRFLLNLGPCASCSSFFFQTSPSRFVKKQQACAMDCKMGIDGICGVASTRWQFVQGVRKNSKWYANWRLTAVMRLWLICLQKKESRTVGKPSSFGV